MTNSPFRLSLLAAAVSLGLAGCTGQNDGSASDSYLGRSVADYVADHGSPDSQIPLTENRSLFRWDLASYAMGPAIGSGLTARAAPSSPVQSICSVTLVATSQSTSRDLKDWTIQGSQRQGVC
jgi:hypothetical protein